MRFRPAPGTLAVAIAKSQNGKLGDAATTYAAQDSCPPDCVFFNGGCYAEEGWLGQNVTSRLNEAARADGRATPLEIAYEEAAAIDELAGEGRPLRLHTVGDCATNEAALVVSLAAERYMARGGGPVWTYTHAWRTVTRESWGKVSVLASCETPMDVELARARGYAPALVVETFGSERRYTLTEAATKEPTPPESVDGADAAAVSVLPCPSQTRSVHCSDCRLCFDDEAVLERGYAIGFALHGLASTVRKAKLALHDPSNPLRRLGSRDLIPAYLELHPDATTAEMADAFDMAPTSVGEMRRRLTEEGVLSERMVA